MILFVFAFLLYLAGFVGVLADGSIELWLWFSVTCLIFV